MMNAESWNDGKKSRIAEIWCTENGQIRRKWDDERSLEERLLALHSSDNCTENQNNIEKH